MGARRGAYGVLVRNPMERNDLEDLGMDGSIMLKWMFNKTALGGGWTVLMWLRMGTGGGFQTMW